MADSMVMNAIGRCEVAVTLVLLASCDRTGAPMGAEAMRDSGREECGECQARVRVCEENLKAAEAALVLRSKIALGSEACGPCAKGHSCLRAANGLYKCYRPCKDDGECGGGEYCNCAPDAIVAGAKCTYGGVSNTPSNVCFPYEAGNGALNGKGSGQ